MGNFSVNQVRHLYVAKDVKTTKVTNTDDEGTIFFTTDKSQENGYFQYMGANKTLMRSDLIPLNNVLYVKAINADNNNQKTALKQAVVKLDKDVNEGNPISGQDYILRIVINPYIGMSDEEPYIKYGVVHGVAKMTTGKFYSLLAGSLYKNFSREIGKMLEFTISGKVVDRVKTDEFGKETLYDKEGKAITVADNYADGVTITEVEQEWVLGTKEQTFVNFKVIPTTVTYNGDEVTWGIVEYSNSDTVINNGKKIADLEYFCMGERGDQYRNISWPNVITTKYMVDATKPYHILEVHYAYTGANEGPQKSEKDIEIVCEDKTKLTTLIGQLTKAGITVTNASVNVEN